MKLFLFLSLLLTLNSYAQIATNQPIKAQDILDIKNAVDLNTNERTRVKTVVGARISGNVSINSGSPETLVIFNSEQKDSNNEYNTSGLGRFVPQKSGRYLFDSVIWYSGAGAVNQACYIAYRVFNSSNQEQSSKTRLSPVMSNAGDRLSCSASLVLDLDLGDYVVIRLYHTDAANSPLAIETSDTFNSLSITEL